jgi:hypothetical protein
MARGLSTDNGSQTALQRIKTDVAARLRSVCAGMSDAEFDQLVERIAAIQVKYNLRRSEDLFMHGDRAPRTVPDSE